MATVYVLVESYCDNPEDDSNAGSNVNYPVNHVGVFNDRETGLVAAQGRVDMLLAEGDEEYGDTPIVTTKSVNLGGRFVFYTEVTASSQVYFVELIEREITNDEPCCEAHFPS
jgi:hypothetical protein